MRPSCLRRSDSALKIAAVAFFWIAAASVVPAQSPVTVNVDLATPGPIIPDNFLGVSYEMSAVLPDSSGHLYFSPANTALIQTFNVLGLKSLRIGGNAADLGPIPSQSDVTNLFGFAESAGVDVFYTLKLKDSDAAANAPIADFIVANYGSLLTCFVVGNEPNFYVKSFGDYETDVNKYMAAIHEGKFCGADAEDGGSYAAHFAAAYDHSPRVALATQHHYLGSGPSNEGSKGRDVLLSASDLENYANLLKGLEPAIGKDGLTFRITETNSFSRAGGSGSSNSFASALWGLDYLHWWASHGAVGLNFHTGDVVTVGGGTVLPALYAVFTTAQGGYFVHPLGYAVKAFDVGGHGTAIPVSLSNPDGVNLTAYGVLGTNALYLTVINKEHDSGAKTAKVTFSGVSAYKTGAAMFLSAPGNDVAATAGITLGGSEIANNGTWTGMFSSLAAPTGGRFELEVPPATAVVVRLE